MELGLEFVTIVGPNFSNAEWKLFDNIVNEIDGVCLREFFCLTSALMGPNRAIC